MPTAPKTYHHHLIYLPNLFIIIYLSYPPRNQPPTHLPPRRPSRRPAPTPPPSNPPKLQRERTKKTGVPPARRQGSSPPRPQPARALTPDAASRTQTELRTQHPRPRSTGSREGRDAPCRSRSPEQEGKQATTSTTRAKSIMKENCDIAIFVVRLIVAVRFPNTKVRTRNALLIMAQMMGPILRE